MKTQVTKQHNDTFGISLAKKTITLRSVVVALVVVLATLGYAGAQIGGPWTPLTNTPSFGADMALLLTDGTVMVHDSANTSNWWRLTPDQYGSYINGKWSALAPLPSGYCPWAFASAVLKDGRVIVEGGEDNYCGSGAGESTLGAIFDPTVVVTGKMIGKWKPVVPPEDPPGSPWTTIGDAPSVVLANGTFMLGNCCTSINDQMDALLTGDPTKSSPNPWTPTGLLTIQAENNNEEGWTLLPDGSVLKINGAWAVPWTSGDASERYLPPPVGAWTPAGALCADLFQHTSSYGEIGPAILRPDGTVFATGSNAYGAGHTCIYHTSPSDPDYLTWTSGPDFQNGLDMADGPAVLLPNGNVLVAASPGFYAPPASFYEFDLTNNWNPVLAPGNVPTRNNDSSESIRMLPLPTGQVLFMDGSSDVEIYTPSNRVYDPSWAPQISGSPFQSGQIYNNLPNQISGLQFNGMSQAAAFGDEFQSATNYPLVRITTWGIFGKPGEVYYCRTHNHTSMGVQTGNLTVSTFFDCPDVPTGTFGSLQVVANGIPSNPVWVSVVAGCVPPTYCPPNIVE